MTYFMAWRESVLKNRECIFDTKNKRINIVPPVVKLRHAKVVVSRQYTRKQPVSGIRVRPRVVGVVDVWMDSDPGM